MKSSGYSGTPLIKKLGILPSSKLLLLNAPSEYFELLGEDFSENVVKSGKTLPSFPLQEERDAAKDENLIVHWFVAERKDLENQFLKLIKDLPSMPSSGFPGTRSPQKFQQILRKMLSGK